MADWNRETDYRILESGQGVYDPRCKKDATVLSMKKIIGFFILVSYLLGQGKINFSACPLSVSDSPRDTLSQVSSVPSGIPQIHFKKKVIRTASFTGVVSFAGLAWYFQSKADQHFDNYLHSGDPNTMNSEWNRTEELDKISGLMVVLSQVCSQILILTYIEYE